MSRALLCCSKSCSHASRLWSFSMSAFLHSWVSHLQFAKYQSSTLAGTTLNETFIVVRKKLSLYSLLNVMSGLQAPHLCLHCVVNMQLLPQWMLLHWWETNGSNTHVLFTFHLSINAEHKAGQAASTIF